MIINEKYLQDIDDDDEDVVVDMPHKVVSDKNTFEHHVIVELKNTHLQITPTRYQTEKFPKNGKLTYGVMNDIYDTIDSYMDSIITVSDYKINIKMRFKKDDYLHREDVEPPYDSDEDYGTEGYFLTDQEVVRNIRFEIDFDSSRMNFEQLNGIVHLITDTINDIKDKYTFNSTEPLPLSYFYYTVDGIEFEVKRNDLAYCMKNALGSLFKSKADRAQIEKPNPKKLEYKDNCRLSSKSEKTVDEFRFGDLLYETENGELVSQATDENGKKNTAIAVNIFPERFMSLRFMSLYNPSLGTKRFSKKECLMPYGSKGSQQNAFIAPSFEARHGNPLNHQVSDYSGAEDYEMMLLYMNKQLKKEDVHTSYVPNSNVRGLLQGAFCTYLFHTKGTKSGQWYIPSPSELYFAFGRQTLVSTHQGEYVQPMKDKLMVVSDRNGDKFNNIQVLMWRFENEYHMKAPWMTGDAVLELMTSREQNRNTCTSMDVQNKAHICYSDTECDKRKLTAVLPFIHINP